MREDIIAIICPDIHGRGFWKVVAEEYDGSVPIIFLGDYIDPYGQENITPKDAKDNFENLWSFKEKWGDKVIMLLGNHDMSYYDKAFRCCRFSIEISGWYNDILHKNWQEFKIAHEIEHNGQIFLFSHAGVHPEWLEQNGFEHNYNADYINELFKTQRMAFGDYSYYRGGGYWETGSPIWADIREFDDFINKKDKSLALPKKVKQIVGHTQLTANMVDLGDICCIDSRQAFVITKDNVIEPYNI